MRSPSNYRKDDNIPALLISEKIDAALEKHYKNTRKPYQYMFSKHVEPGTIDYLHDAYTVIGWKITKLSNIHGQTILEFDLIR